VRKRGRPHRQEVDRRHAVDDQRAGQLEPVGVLEAQGEQHAHGRQHDDAHSRAEVAAVEGHQELDDPQRRRHLALPLGAVRLDEAAQRALDGDQGAGEEDEPGDDGVEGLLRRVKQDPGAGQAADGRGERQQHRAPLLVGDDLPVGPGGGDRAGPHRQGVGGVGRHAPHAREQQRREGEQGAAPGDGVDDSRAEAGCCQEEPDHGRAGLYRIWAAPPLPSRPGIGLRPRPGRG
jgi:hypothetical protein